MSEIPEIPETPVTWETYDWSKHDSKHYQDVQNSYAPLIIRTPDDSNDLNDLRVGLIKISGYDKWRLPIGSALQDNEKIETAVTRAFYRMFDVNKLEELISRTANIKDTDYFTFSISDGDEYSVATCSSNSTTWAEKDLNDHIVHCNESDERPRWNKPGEMITYTDYHVINIGSQSNAEYLNTITSGYVQKFSCFTEEEIDELFKSGDVDESAYETVMDYFKVPKFIHKKSRSSRNPDKYDTENEVDVFNGAEVDDSALYALYLVLAFIALELAVIFAY